MNAQDEFNLGVADIGSDQADLDPSTDRYAKRFQGVAGTWLLSRQTKALEHVLGDTRGAVLDVGGGHGQIAPVLLDKGCDVTVHASTERALLQASKLSSNRLTLSTGSLRQLPFEDQSFDVVTSFRIMAHIGDWRSFLSELMRVAKSAVVIDYPISGGMNALQPLLFQFKRMMEGDTRKFDTISTKEIRDVLAESGFADVASFEQFVLPMVVHRKLKSAKFSETSEGFLRALGFHRYFGTPVVLRADRQV